MIICNIIDIKHSYTFSSNDIITSYEFELDNCSGLKIMNKYIVDHNLFENLEKVNKFIESFDNHIVLYYNTQKLSLDPLNNNDYWISLFICFLLALGLSSFIFMEFKEK